MGFNEIFLSALFVLVTTFGIIITKKIINYANAKIDNIQETTRIQGFKDLQSTIDVAQDLVATAVLTVSQTYVDKLKSDGTFTKEAQELAKSKAIEIVTSLLNENIKSNIEYLYGNYDKWLDATIETLVKANK